VNQDLLKEFSPEVLQAHLDRIGHRKQECTGCKHFWIDSDDHASLRCFPKMALCVFVDTSTDASDLAEFNKNAEGCTEYQYWEEE